MLGRKLFRHLSAIVYGKGLSDELARDLWTSREDLWDPKGDVKFRFLKLLFVYALSIVTQVLMPGLILIGIVVLANRKSLDVLLIGIGIIAITAFPLAIIVTIGTYLKVVVAQRRNK